VRSRRKGNSSRPSDALWLHEPVEAPFDPRIPIVSHLEEGADHVGREAVVAPPLGVASDAASPKVGSLHPELRGGGDLGNLPGRAQIGEGEEVPVGGEVLVLGIVEAFGVDPPTSRIPPGQDHRCPTGRGRVSPGPPARRPASAGGERPKPLRCFGTGDGKLRGIELSDLEERRCPIPVDVFVIDAMVADPPTAIVGRETKRKVGGIPGKMKSMTRSWVNSRMNSSTTRSLETVREVRSIRRSFGRQGTNRSL
jgi:hypothetical protein